MKVIHYTEVPGLVPEGNFEGVSIRWVITDRDGAKGYAMRVFEIEPGGSTPFHRHPWEHAVFGLEGDGAVKTTTDEIPLREGVVMYIKPNEKHQFVNGGESILRFICVVPEEAYS